MNKKPRLNLMVSILSLLLTISSFIVAVLSYLLSWDSIIVQVISSIFGVLFGAVTALFISSYISYITKREDQAEVDSYYERIKGSVYIQPSRVNSDNHLLELKDISNKHKSPEDNTESVKDIKSKPESIFELMINNMREIKEYYVLSKSQAKKAFTVALVMGIMGFVLLTAAILLAIFIKDSYAAAIIAASGAVVVDLLSAIFLMIYKKSLEQLNHYYTELHNNEIFLSTINLVDNISKSKKDDVYIDIIRSRIVCNKN